jgi:nitroreductase/dihydropteridine reductase
MGLIEQLEWRYATKKFDDQRNISKDDLDLLKKTFALTATS